MSDDVGRGVAERNIHVERSSQGFGQRFLSGRNLEQSFNVFEAFSFSPNIFYIVLFSVGRDLFLLMCVFLDVTFLGVILEL